MQLPSLHIWITDAGYMIFSTLISVAVHEFGHAVAAARSVSWLLLFTAFIEQSGIADLHMYLLAGSLIDKEMLYLYPLLE